MDGAYYYGNSSGNNTLTVGSDKTKASAKTLGDDVVIDLTAKDDNDRNIYNNIKNVNAASSNNRVVLTAASTGSNLTGGTYQSTLKSGSGSDTLTGGSGADVFYFDDVNGTDTVKSYASGKDSIYLGGSSDLKDAGYTITADAKNNVVITKTGATGSDSITITGAANPAKAISISKDGVAANNSGNTKNTVDYYVGKTGARVSNAFTYVEGAYYIGNTENEDATSTAKYLDTLKITGTVRTSVKSGAKLTIDMSAGNQYQSIEAIDASGRKVANKVDSTYAGVDVTASKNGTRFTGTIYADTFTCGDGKDYIVYTKNAGNDTIKGFGVDDVIKLNGLSNADIASLTSQISKINNNNGAGIINIGGNKLTFSGATASLSYDSKTKSIIGKAN